MSDLPDVAAAAAQKQWRLASARTEAAARYQAAAFQFSTATAASVDALQAMLAAAMELDYLSRHEGGSGAAEMRFTDYILGELRMCFDHMAATTTSPRDAVVGPARAAADARIAELRALMTTT